MATEVKVPDIGGETDVEVIEVLVKPGDKVAADDSLMTLESEKAAMDVPAPFAGTVNALTVKVGDKVSEGSVILTMDAEGEAPAEKKAEKKAEEKPALTSAQVQELKVPDIGGETDVDVIEVAIKAGDQLQAEQTVATLESEKAAMDVPAEFAGKVTEVKVKVGDKVSEGTVLALVEVQGSTAQAKPVKEKPAEKAPEAKTVEAAPASKPAPVVNNTNVYASPSVRRLARELKIDLSQVNGTGEKGRITKTDLNGFITSRMQGGGSGGALPSAPSVDFSKFGEIETEALSRINKLTGKNMQRNWLLVPHVTQFDEADITDMEAFRQQNKSQAEKEGFKLTPLVFIMKAVVSALKTFPRFNASLDPSAERLIMKKYFHIGVAVDTPNGLVVPVVRDVDQKGLFDLAKELGEISKKARDGKLLPKDMQGGCFTISSLGGIGGTAFTPIVNVPEVAILGVSKSQMKPIYNGKDFEPRLMLPLSLSYDHRVIDGALGARFVVYLSQCLADLRKLLL